MVVLVSLTIGLIFWICAWAFGVKSFDAFMVTTALLVVAGGVFVFRPFVRRALGHDE